MSAIFTDIDVPFALAVEHVTLAEFEAAGFQQWLAEAERIRFEELKTHAVAKRCRQWLLGRYAAKVACRRWLEGQGKPVVDWQAIQISNDPNGMPKFQLDGMKDSPALSIAHSGDEAVAAVAAPGNPIGIDIETGVARSNLPELAKRISSEQEYLQWFADATEDELAERFLQLWLAKEATAKCTGMGLQWRLATFEVRKIGHFELTVAHDGNDYTVYLSNSSGRAMCALAFLRG